MYKKSIIIGLLLFCGSFGGSAEKIIKLTTLDDYPPFCFRDEVASKKLKRIIPPGEDAITFKGYSWDVVRESYHAVGYTIHLILAPWARAMLFVESGDADLIFPATKTKERLEKFHYSEFSTDRQNFLIYVRSDSNFKWKGLESLKGFRIGTMNEWSFGQKWDAADFIDKYPTFKVVSALMMLENHRLDGVVGYEITFDYELKKAGIAHKIKKLPSFDYSEEFLIGLKKHPQVKMFIEDFDRGREIIIHNGVFEKINKKWLAN
ncbi:transporter substrate-binding domain-containing protein [Deltaproteobacteria bacterium TL4]